MQKKWKNVRGRVAIWVANQTSNNFGWKAVSLAYRNLYTSWKCHVLICFKPQISWDVGFLWTLWSLKRVNIYENIMNILDILGSKWLEPKMHLQLENIYCNCGSPEPAPVLGSGPPPKRRTPKMLGFCLRIYVYFFESLYTTVIFLGKKTCFFPTKNDFHLEMLTVILLNKHSRDCRDAVVVDALGRFVIRFISAPFIFHMWVLKLKARLTLGNWVDFGTYHMDFLYSKVTLPGQTTTSSAGDEKQISYCTCYYNCNYS